MKVVFDENKIIVFLHETFIDGFDLKDESKLENYFKNLFLKLKKRYNINFNGYFDIEIYSDKNYGMILEIEEVEVEYYQYFQGIDMKMNIHQNSFFLYAIDFDNMIFQNVNYYKMKDQIYVEVKDKIDDIAMGRLLECSNIIYGEKKDTIIKYGKKVSL